MTPIRRNGRRGWYVLSVVPRIRFCRWGFLTVCWGNVGGMRVWIIHGLCILCLGMVGLALLMFAGPETGALD